MTSLTDTAMLEQQRLTARFKLVVFAVLAAGSLAFTMEALTFHQLAMYAPLGAGGLMSLLFVLAVVREVTTLRRIARGLSQAERVTLEDSGEVVTRAGLISSVRFFVILSVYVVAIILVGMVVAAVVMLPLLLWFESRRGPRFLVVSTVGLLIAFWLLSTFMDLSWPQPIFL